MCRMSVGKRGKRIQELGLAIDRRLHPHGDFSFAKGNRGRSNAPADWVRCTDRVELKSCRLTFNRSQNLWRCDFQHIKPDLFDELWLAIYTSVGIHYYRSKPSLIQSRGCDEVTWPQFDFLRAQRRA